MKEKIIEWIKELKASRYGGSISDTELGEVAGVSRQAASKWRTLGNVSVESLDLLSTHYKKPLPIGINADESKKGSVINFPPPKIKPIHLTDKTAITKAIKEKGEKGFVVQMNGDSMHSQTEEKNIPDGSAVVFKACKAPTNGKVVLAYIGKLDSYVIKKHIQDAGMSYLTSLNSNYKQIEITEDIDILAYAVSVNISHNL
jgi:SOS-response transcriptional repressor LexA